MKARLSNSEMVWRAAGAGVGFHGESIYNVELRKDDPYDAAKCLQKFGSIQEAHAAL